MTIYSGPLGRALAREPATDRQLGRVARLMADAGVAFTDPEWPATVARILGPTASPDPAAWSKSDASCIIDTLDEYLWGTK